MTNPSARTKFALISPELARLCEEAKTIFERNHKDTSTGHHENSKKVTEKQENVMSALTQIFTNFGSPLEEDQGKELYNLATKVVMPDNVKSDLLQQRKTGQNLFTKFV